MKKLGCKDLNKEFEEQDEYVAKLTMYQRILADNIDVIFNNRFKLRNLFNRLEQLSDKFLTIEDCVEALYVFNSIKDAIEYEYTIMLKMEDWFGIKPLKNKYQKFYKLQDIMQLNFGKALTADRDYQYRYFGIVVNRENLNATLKLYHRGVKWEM